MCLTGARRSCLGFQGAKVSAVFRVHPDSAAHSSLLRTEQFPKSQQHQSIEAFNRSRLTGLKIIFVFLWPGPRVAVLNAAGSIAASGSPITATELNEMLREVEEDPSVKAVVLRIDSPGASMEPCLFRRSIYDRPDSLSSTDSITLFLNEPGWRVDRVSL